MAVRARGGRRARTAYEVLDLRRPGGVVARVPLETGRTIRSGCICRRSVTRWSATPSTGGTARPRRSRRAVPPAAALAAHPRTGDTVRVEEPLARPTLPTCSPRCKLVSRFGRGQSSADRAAGAGVTAGAGVAGVSLTGPAPAPARRGRTGPGSRRGPRRRERRDGGRSRDLPPAFASHARSRPRHDDSPTCLAALSARRGPVEELATRPSPRGTRPSVRSRRPPASRLPRS